MTDTITIPRALLEQALTALNNITDYDGLSKARQSLRLALEQPQEDSPICPLCGSDCNERDELIKAEREVERLQALLAEQPQQPSYWEEEARRYAGNADYWRERCKALEQPQPTGKAPCARFCEANAFRVEIRSLEAQLAKAQQENKP